MAGALHTLIHLLLTTMLRVDNITRNEEIGVYSPQYKGLISLPEKSLFVSGLEPPCSNWGFPLTMTSGAARRARPKTQPQWRGLSKASAQVTNDPWLTLLPQPGRPLQI